MANSSNDNSSADITADITADIEGKYITRTEIDSIIGEIFNNSVVNIDALKQHIPVDEIMALVVNIVNNKIQEHTNRDIKITNLRLEDMNFNVCGTGNIINPNCNTSNTTIAKVDGKTSNVVKKPLISIRQATEEELQVFQYYNEIDSSDEENEDKITLKKYLLEVEDSDDIRSMFMGMILDLKERIKGCEQCETCSEVIKIVDKFIADYKKIYKLADQMANLFMQFIINKSKLKLNPNQKKLLEFIFIIIMKNSSFSDLEYIYKCFHNNIDVNIDVNMYDGLAFRLAIQKHNSTNIEKLISWGADITIRNHRAIVRAFYHERFKTIKLLMEKGSSYKYYLMSELDKDEYEYVYKEIQKLINDDLPDDDADELSKEYKFLDILIKYIIIRTKENKKENQLDDSDFIYDFVEHLNINLDNIKIKPNTTDATDAIDKVAKVSKVEKNKKDILEQKTLSKAQAKLMKLEEQQKLEAKKEKKKEKKKLQKESKLQQQQTSNTSNTNNTSSMISNPTVIDTENTGKTTTSNVDVDITTTTPVDSNDSNDSNNINNNELTTELIVNTEMNNKVVEKDNNNNFGFGFGLEFDVNDYYFNYYNNHFKKVFEQYSPEHKFIHYARIEGL